MRWDQDTRDDADMTLNEADVLGLRLEPSGAWCDLLLHVVALPESGPIDPAWMLRVMPADSKSEVPISHTISTGDS